MNSKKKNKIKSLKNRNTAVEPWLNVIGISTHLGISKETTYRLLDRKLIPCHRIGKLWKFKASEVDRAVVNGKFK